MKWILLAMLALSGQAAELKPQTSEQFDRYIHQAEQRLERAQKFPLGGRLPGSGADAPAREPSSSNRSERSL